MMPVSQETMPCYRDVWRCMVEALVKEGESGKEKCPAHHSLSIKLKYCLVLFHLKRFKYINSTPLPNNFLRVTEQVGPC